MAAKNMADLIKNIRKQLDATILLVAQDVQEYIQKELDKYYSEYDPAKYIPRTHQLQNCCVVSQPQIINNSIKVDVYLDIESLHYITKGADPFKTVVSADYGLHGGWDIEDKHIVPWEQISPQNTGDVDTGGNGTSIWTVPITEILTTKKIRQWFMEAAKKYGLPLR